MQIIAVWRKTYCSAIGVVLICSIGVVWCAIINIVHSPYIISCIGTKAAIVQGECSGTIFEVFRKKQNILRTRVKNCE